MHVFRCRVGETLVYETGTYATTLAVLLPRGGHGDEMRLRFPGGPLVVHIKGGHVFLTEPAVLVVGLSFTDVAGYSGR